MSQTLTPNQLNGLLIQKSLLENKITDLKNELDHNINTINAINIILKEYFNSSENNTNFVDICK